MKELKFRVWDGKKMIDDVTPASETSILELFEYEWQETEVEAVEQYTGLKDKNGKEIYEGDIVEYTTCYYGNEKRHRKVVEWSEWDSDDFGEPHNLGYSNLSECMEVIGNVHENADLMREK